MVGSKEDRSINVMMSIKKDSINQTKSQNIKIPGGGSP